MAPEAHSAGAATPALDMDQLLMLAAQYQAHPHQAHAHSVQSSAGPYPPDPGTLTLAGIPYQPAKSAHLAGQPLQTREAAVQANGNWAPGATPHMGGEAYGHGQAAPQIDSRMPALLAAMQRQPAAQKDHAGQAQPTPEGPSYLDSAQPEAAPQRQQQQQQQQQVQQQAQQPQNMPQMPAELQGQQPMWPDPATMQVLQHLLQQSRAPRPWTASEVSSGPHADAVAFIQACVVTHVSMLVAVPCTRRTT